jgi:predicted lysophospholipase L1 biosynthesis ABC-type transport system permease subunit
MFGASDRAIRHRKEQFAKDEKRQKVITYVILAIMIVVGLLLLAMSFYTEKLAVGQLCSVAEAIVFSVGFGVMVIRSMLWLQRTKEHNNWLWARLGTRHAEFMREHEAEMTQVMRMHLNELFSIFSNRPPPDPPQA